MNVNMKQVIAFILTLLPIGASADDHGSCGETLTYTYVEADKTLTISGSGEMTDYKVPNEWGEHVPWIDYQNNIEHIVIEPGVASIGNAAFFRCENMKTVKIPAGVTCIGHEAFHYCYDLTSLTIPQSVDSIGSQAFQGCSGLTSIVVEEGNAKYDSREHCNALIETASGQLLLGCEETTFPEGIKGIVSRAFYGSPIRVAAFPSSLEFIGHEAFKGCGCLKTVEFCEGIDSISSNAFENCPGLTLVSLPNSLTSLGGAAFSGCTNLESVTLSNQLTEIQGHLFEHCEKLKEVTIPENVVDVWSYAFSYCSSLTSLTCLNPEPPRCIGMTEFDVDLTIPLYVPVGCVDKYKAAQCWRYFVHIYEVTEKPATLIFGTKADVGQDDAPYYNLNGVRVAQPCKGIYIQNGKKVIVK